jgi:acetyl-CoA carboxylase biotin carboxylase subunit
MEFGDIKMKVINTILVANRGEIASRIIRTCKAMGIRSIAVYSDADKNSKYVREADLAYHIGENTPSKSYLNQNKIIEIALKANAQAIHPGYGFLSENADFVARCNENQLIFIGPKQDAIKRMGSKAEAKALMQTAGVPILPGYNGTDQSNDILEKEAEKIGFPLLLKASAGGGGKGMRIVRALKELPQAIKQAKREALNAFGDDYLIIEKYIESSRHIEFQIFGDQHGNIIHLGERDCTVQRRYQKIIEESPSAINENTRAKMANAAIKAASSLDYENAGTVEFIYDLQQNDFYFLEINTRLQVEHPVTEMVLGIDLVKLQIQTAMGKALEIKQEDLNFNGHAIEVRLYAEDPAQNFSPQTGKIHLFENKETPSFRIDSGIESGSEVTIFYDPMLGKLIAHGENRHLAISKLRYHLNNTICQGTKTNIDYLAAILKDDLFISNKFDTSFANHFKEKRHSEAVDIMISAASSYLWQEREASRKLLKNIPSNWRNIGVAQNLINFQINEFDYVVKYSSDEDRLILQINDIVYQVSILNVAGHRFQMEINGQQSNFTITKAKDKIFIHSSEYGNEIIQIIPLFPDRIQDKEKGDYEAAMPSQIIDILVHEQNEIKEGDPLIIISSMKMENTILAHEAGIVESVLVNKGDNVESGTLLIKIKEK